MGQVDKRWGSGYLISLLIVPLTPAIFFEWPSVTFIIQDSCKIPAPCSISTKARLFASYKLVEGGGSACSQIVLTFQIHGVKSLFWRGLIFNPSMNSGWQAWCSSEGRLAVLSRAPYWAQRLGMGCFRFSVSVIFLWVPIMDPRWTFVTVVFLSTKFLSTFI